MSIENGLKSIVPSITFNLGLNESILGSGKTQNFEVTLNNRHKTKETPTIKLNNGNLMPIFGLGTYKCAPGVVTRMVMDAIDAGYKHIDCAMKYENEKEVGEALKIKFKRGVIERKDLFITSKLWCHAHSRELVIPTLKQTLDDLGLEYVDMYLIHWPMGLKETGELVPKNPDGSLAFSDVDYIETWKGMEDAYKMGLARAIGVSNFNSEQLQRVLDIASVIPANNQIEVSPYMANTKLVNLCQSKGIVITGFSPLGGSVTGGKPKIMDEPVIKDLANKYGKCPAQIVLRWSVQRNIVTIPKSIHKERINSNRNIFDFNLTNTEMAQINNLDCNGRAIALDAYKPHQHYPFNIPY